MAGNLKKIILIDGNPSDLQQGEQILKPFYEVFSAPAAANLFELLKSVPPDLILLDIDAGLGGDMGGLDTVKKLKSDSKFESIPIIFLMSLGNLNSRKEGFDLGASDYVTKPFLAPLLIKRIEKELLFAQQTKDLTESRNKLDSFVKGLENMVSEKVSEIVDLQSAVLATVADLVEFRDKHTGGHIVRTQLYIKALIDGLYRRGYYKETIQHWDINALLASSQLHDVGKIAIPDNILCKPGRLTDGEFDKMKAHVAAGVEAIKRMLENTNNSTLLSHALAIAGSHHERWDGSGYPAGLKGGEIPLEGRLMAIADVYDALITDRSYKQSLTHEEACRIIESGADRQFDPLLIEVFKDVNKEFARIVTGLCADGKTLKNVWDKNQTFNVKINKKTSSKKQYKT